MTNISIAILSKFANQHDLLNHAKDFIKTRMDALKKDIDHCIKTQPYAPFPALIYCFSNIDLELFTQEELIRLLLQHKDLKGIPQHNNLKSI